MVKQWLNQDSLNHIHKQFSKLFESIVEACGVNEESFRTSLKSFFTEMYWNNIVKFKNLDQVEDFEVEVNNTILNFDNGLSPVEIVDRFRSFYPQSEKSKFKASFSLFADFKTSLPEEERNRFEDRVRLYQASTYNFFRELKNQISSFYRDNFKHKISTSDEYLISSDIKDCKYGNWGEWAPIERCPLKQFVVGIQTKFEKAGHYDDTALNGVKAICSGGKEITSGVGKWGGWGSKEWCWEGQRVNEFQIRIEPSRGLGDDTATNAVRFVCTDRKVLISAEGERGEFLPKLFRCKSSYYVCGIQTQIAPHGGDDTALNNFNVLCCAD
jgi:hypothetical protein